MNILLGQIYAIFFDPYNKVYRIKLIANVRYLNRATNIDTKSWNHIILVEMNLDKKIV